MSIEISRKDILSEYICDYSPEDKFLKLPVAPYMDILGITSFVEGLERRTLE